MSLLDKAREEPKPAERDAWYRCPCGYKTKQKRGLPEVAHRCPQTEAMRAMKEDTT